MWESGVEETPCADAALREASLSCSRKTEWQRIGDKRWERQVNFRREARARRCRVLFSKKTTLGFGLRQWEAVKDFWTESNMMWLWIFQGLLWFWCRELTISSKKESKGTRWRLLSAAESREVNNKYSIRNGKGKKKKWMGLNYILEKNQLDFLIGWIWQEDENRRNYSHLKCLAFD